jgi:hypothetical protein
MAIEPLPQSVVMSIKKVGIIIQKSSREAYTRFGDWKFRYFHLNA